MGNYARLLAYIKPYRARLIVAAIFTFAYSISHSLVSGVIYVAVNGFYSNGSVVFDNLPSISFIRQISIPADYIPYVIFLVLAGHLLLDQISNNMAANGYFILVRALNGFNINQVSYGCLIK